MPIQGPHSIRACSLPAGLVKYTSLTTDLELFGVPRVRCQGLDAQKPNLGLRRPSAHVDNTAKHTYLVPAELTRRDEPELPQTARDAHTDELLGVHTREWWVGELGTDVWAFEQPPTGGLGAGMHGRASATQDCRVAGLATLLGGCARDTASAPLTG